MHIRLHVKAGTISTTYKPFTSSFSFGFGTKQKTELNHQTGPDIYCSSLIIKRTISSMFVSSEKFVVNQGPSTEKSNLIYFGQELVPLFSLTKQG
jgi:hypothetical protein